MPVIRITDTTWDRLKQWAIPLEDTPEDAVRKVIDAAEEHQKCHQTVEKSRPIKATIEEKRKLTKNQKTLEGAYRPYLLEALYELGGRASTGDVLEIVERKMKTILNEVDYQTVPSGEIRWFNTAKWERWTLVKEGLLKSKSEVPKGIWELSEKGIEEVTKGKT
ncbi:winged helix-turn-helix domain-containing protein [Chloroflexota bacterium]